MCAASPANQNSPASRRAIERRLEQWERRLEVATGTEHAAALELEPDVGNGIGARERLSLVEELGAAPELAPHALDAGELRQDLGTPGIGLFLGELLAEARRGAVEVVEVPERPEAVWHPAHCRRRLIRG